MAWPLLFTSVKTPPGLDGALIFPSARRVLVELDPKSERAVESGNVVNSRFGLRVVWDSRRILECDCAVGRSELCDDVLRLSTTCEGKAQAYSRHTC